MGRQRREDGVHVDLDNGFRMAVVVSTKAAAAEFEGSLLLMKQYRVSLLPPAVFGGKRSGGRGQPAARRAAVW